MNAIAMTAPRMTVRASRHRRRGYSLLEISVVLTIIGLMIATLLLFFGTASDAEKSSDTVREVLAIESAIYGAYSGQPGYTGLSAAVIAGGRQLPNRWISGSGLVDPYGSPVLIYSDPVNTGWDVVAYGLSAKACRESALSGQQMGSNLVQIVVNPGTPGSSSTPSTGGVGSYGLSQGAWASAVVAACGPGSSIRFSMGS